MSSGEAELHALVKAAIEGIGIQSLALDMGWLLRVRVCTDSSAALSVRSRLGVGKLRHVAVKTLWIQGAVSEGRVAIEKVPGIYNPADVLTKPQTLDEMAWRLEYVGGTIVSRNRVRWTDIEDE